METYRLSKKSTLKFIPDFVKLTKEERESLYKQCPTKKHQIKIYDKYVDLPRYQQAYGKSYSYSGTTAKSKPMPEVIERIRDLIKEELYPNIDFNMCLVNWYNGGNHYIGQHSDDEKKFIKNTPVVGITFCFGLPRKIVFKNKKTKKTVKDVWLYNNSLYSMEGEFQKEFTHGIPKVANKGCGRRVSLTFRCFREE